MLHGRGIVVLRRNASRVRELRGKLGVSRGLSSGKYHKENDLKEKGHDHDFNKASTEELLKEASRLHPRVKPRHEIYAENIEKQREIFQKDFRPLISEDLGPLDAVTNILGFAPIRDLNLVLSQIPDLDLGDEFRVGARKAVEALFRDFVDLDAISHPSLKQDSSSMKAAEELQRYTLHCVRDDGEYLGRICYDHQDGMDVISVEFSPLVDVRQSEHEELETRRLVLRFLSIHPVSTEKFLKAGDILDWEISSIQIFDSDPPFAKFISILRSERKLTKW